jgi:hypothetical protein
LPCRSPRSLDRPARTVCAQIGRATTSLPSVQPEANHVVLARRGRPLGRGRCASQRCEIDGPRVMRTRGRQRCQQRPSGHRDGCRRTDLRRTPATATRERLRATPGRGPDGLDNRAESDSRSRADRVLQDRRPGVELPGRVERLGPVAHRAAGARGLLSSRTFTMFNEIGAAGLRVPIMCLLARSGATRPDSSENSSILDGRQILSDRSAIRCRHRRALCGPGAMSSVSAR